MISLENVYVTTEKVAFVLCTFTFIRFSCALFVFLPCDKTSQLFIMFETGSLSIFTLKHSRHSPIIVQFYGQ